jgi:prefoldin alpha subunit
MAISDPKNMKTDEQTLEELRYLQQVYQNQYAVAGNSINMTLQALQELNSAQKTLENLDLTNGREIVTSLGAEVYAFGKISNPKSVLVAVGAGYLVEKDIDSAKGYAAALIQKHTENLNKITKSRKEIESALIEISYRLENSR